MAKSFFGVDEADAYEHPSAPSAVDTGDFARIKSKLDCRRLGAWGDICVYDDVCYDGRVLYMFDEDKGAKGDPLQAPPFHCDGDLLEGLILPRRENADFREHRLPLNGGEDCG